MQIKSKIVYWLTYGGMWLFGLLPFKALYFISDILYYLVYYVLRYRRRVVRTNLNRSFPEKTPAEIRAVEKKFYHYICDYAVEEVKVLHLSFDELKQRMTYEKTDDYLRLVEQYNGIVILIPHYANFEWLTGMGSIMKPEDVAMQVYKPLHNEYLDKMFQLIRARFGGYNVPKHSTARHLIKLRREGKKVAVGLITDQCPRSVDAKYWTTFLHQDTVFMDGGERIARMMNFPVFYAELTRTSRGHCTVSFDLLTEHPKETADGEITELFVRRLEQTIQHEPAYWFWSHRRWKRSRPVEETVQTPSR